MAQGKHDSAPLERLSFSTPHETRRFPKGKVELITLGGTTFGRATFEPGWRWSQHVKPIVGTDSCQSHHLGVQLSGTLHLKMDDGTEQDIHAGDAINIPPGHDAWVVGDDPVVIIDITGMCGYLDPHQIDVEEWPVI